MNKSVKMVTTKGENGVSGIRVEVDGENIGGGRIGGEPEDNCEYRDYSWIRPMVRALSLALGVKAEEEIIKEEDEDDE